MGAGWKGRESKGERRGAEGQMSLVSLVQVLFDAFSMKKRERKIEKPVDTGVGGDEKSVLNVNLGVACRT